MRKWTVLCQPASRFAETRSWMSEPRYTSPLPFWGEGGRFDVLDADDVEEGNVLDPIHHAGLRLPGGDAGALRSINERHKALTIGQGAKVQDVAIASAPSGVQRPAAGHPDHWSGLC